MLVDVLNALEYFLSFEFASGSGSFIHRIYSLPSFKDSLSWLSFRIHGIHR